MYHAISPQFQSDVSYPAPRLMTAAEIDQVSGGLPFVIAPAVISGAKFAAAAFGGAFFASAGAATYSRFFGGGSGSDVVDDQCSM